MPDCILASHVSGCSANGNPAKKNSMYDTIACSESRSRSGCDVPTVCTGSAHRYSQFGWLFAETDSEFGASNYANGMHDNENKPSRPCNHVAWRKTYRALHTH